MRTSEGEILDQASLAGQLLLLAFSGFILALHGVVAKIWVWCIGDLWARSHFLETPSILVTTLYITR